MLNANDKKQAEDASYGVNLLCEILPEDRKKYKKVRLETIYMNSILGGSNA